MPICGQEIICRIYRNTFCEQALWWQYSLKIGICLIPYDTVFQHKLIAVMSNLLWWIASTWCDVGSPMGAENNLRRFRTLYHCRSSLACAFLSCNSTDGAITCVFHAMLVTRCFNISLLALRPILLGDLCFYRYLLAPADLVHPVNMSRLCEPTPLCSYRLYSVSRPFQCRAIHLVVQLQFNFLSLAI